MKILMISEYFYPEERGGGEISAFLLAEELAKADLEIHILTSYFNGLKRFEKIKGVVIHRSLKTGKNPISLLDNLKRFFAFEKSLLRELEKLDKIENFDIIHCMNISSLPAVKLKNKIKKKFVLHVNSPVLFCPKGTLMYKDREVCEKECNFSTFMSCYLNSNLFGKMNFNFYTKYNPFFTYVIRNRFNKYQSLIKKFDHYMPISNYMKKRLFKIGINKKKITVIPNIVDLTNLFKLKSTKNKVPKILYLGEYSEPKGPQIIIKALKKIKQPYQANFFGEGVLKNYLQNEIRKYKLNVNIHNKIPFKNIPKLFEKHDIVVVPSLVVEAFSRVALEASSAGRAIIASDIGGITDIIKNKKTGFLVPAGDIDKMGQKMIVLLQQKSLRKTFGKNARIYAKSFISKHIIKKVTNCYCD